MKIFNFYTLSKIESNSILNTKLNKKKKFQRVISVLLMIALFVYCGAVIFNIFKGVLEELQKLGLENLIVKAIIILSFYISITFSVVYSGYLVFKDSKENDYLTTMPIKPEWRFLSSYISVIKPIYVVTLVTSILPVIYMGIIFKFGILYYIFSILTLLVLPIIPTIIVYVIGIIFSMILKMILNKKLLRYAGSIITVILMIAYMIFISKMSANGKPDDVLISKIIDITKKKSFLNYIPNLIANLLIEKQYFNLLLIFGLNILFLFGVCLTFGKLYLKLKIWISSTASSGFGLFNFINELRVKYSKDNSFDQKLLTSEESKQKLNLKKKNKIVHLKFKKSTKEKASLKREFGFFTINFNVILNTVLLPVLIPALMIFSGIITFSEMQSKIKHNPELKLVQEIDLQRLKELVENFEHSEEKKRMDKKEILVPKIDESQFIKYRLLDALSKKNKEQKNTETIKAIFEQSSNPEFKKQAEELENFSKMMRKKENVIKKFSLSDLTQENKEQKIQEFTDLLRKIEESGKISREASDSLIREFRDTTDIILSNGFLGNFKFMFNKVKQITNNIEVKNDLNYLLPIIAATFVIYSSSISIYMISKDKAEISYLKTFPISFKKQIFIKKLPNIFLNLSVFLLYILIMVVLKFELLKNIYFYFGILTAVALILSLSNIELFLDLCFPNFNWKQPIQLIKQNVVVFVYIFLKMIIIAGIVFLLVYNKSPLKGKYYTISIFAFTLLILFEILINTIGVKKYSELESN